MSETNVTLFFDSDQQAIIDEAIELDLQEKDEYKAINDLASTAEKDLLVDKTVLKRFKDYTYYCGRGWVNGDPLEREQGTDYPDKVSSTMIKFNQIIQDCITVGNIDFLIPYFTALKGKGINITVDAQQANDERIKRVDQYMQPMCINQKHICDINDQVKLVLTDKAVEQKICSKSKFRSIVRLNSRIKKCKEKGQEPSKEIDKLTDMYMDAAADLTGAEKSINNGKDNRDGLGI